MSGEPLEMFGFRPHRIGALASLLVEKGWDVTWFTTTYDHQQKEFLYTQDTIVNSGDVKMIFLHSSIAYKRNIGLRRILNHARVAHKFTKISASLDKPDIILCCYPTIELSYSVVKYSILKNVKSIIDIRDLWPDIFYQVFPKSLGWLLDFILAPFHYKKRFIFKNCYAVFGISKNYLGWSYAFRKKGPDDRVFELGYSASGPDDLSNTNLGLEAFGIKEHAVKVWFVGTFGRTYDLLPVIKAAKSLLEKGYNFQFIFSGDGEMGDFWRQEAGDHKGIIFTGWIDRSNLTAVSRTIDIGIMAYRVGAPQGLPNKLFELMALGVPILCSLKGESLDVIERYDLGEYYDPMSPAGLERILKTYYDDKSLRIRQGNNSRKVFVEKYSSESIYSSMEKHLSTLVEKG